MNDPLARFEDEMAGAAAEAAVRLRLARVWLQWADEDLAALQRPTWDAHVVDEYHRAAAAVQDSLEALAAYELFTL